MVEVVVGKNGFLVNRSVEELLKQHQDRIGPHDVQRFDATTRNFVMQQVLEAVQTVSLFGSQKSVVVTFGEALEEQWEAPLVDLIMHSNPDVFIVFTFEKKPPVKNQVGKALAKNARVQTLKDPVSTDIKAFIRGRIKHDDLNFTPSAIDELARRVGTDLIRCSHELDKLAVLDGIIDEVMIEQLVAKNFDEDIFALSNALIDKNVVSAFKIYENLRAQKVDPLALLGLVGSSLRRLYQISALAETGASTARIADRLSLSEKQTHYVLRNQARNSFQLLKLLNELGRIDQEVKRGKIDRFIAFELFMVESVQ